MNQGWGSDSVIQMSIRQMESWVVAVTGTRGVLFRYKHQKAKAKAKAKTKGRGKEKKKRVARMIVRESYSGNYALSYSYGDWFLR